MKKQLELLVKLQECDSAIRQALRTQENHPRMIAQLEESLAREREELRLLEKLLDESKKSGFKRNRNWPSIKTRCKRPGSTLPR